LIKEKVNCDEIIQNNNPKSDCYMITTTKFIAKVKKTIIKPVGSSLKIKFDFNVKINFSKNKPTGTCE